MGGVRYPFRVTIIPGPCSTIKILQKTRRQGDNVWLPTLLLFPDCKSVKARWGRQGSKLPSLGRGCKAEPKGSQAPRQPPTVDRTPCASHISSTDVLLGVLDLLISRVQRESTCHNFGCLNMLHHFTVLSV